MLDLIADYLGVEVKIIRYFLVETCWFQLTEDFVVENCVNSQLSRRDFLLLSNRLDELGN